MRLVEGEEEEGGMEQVNGGEGAVTMLILSRWPGEAR